MGGLKNKQIKTQEHIRYLATNLSLCFRSPGPVLKSRPGVSRRAQFGFMNVLNELLKQREWADFKRVVAVGSVFVGVV